MAALLLPAYYFYAMSQQKMGTPFGGKPWPIPGLIQAENFDEGPEGVAYHDTDTLRGT